MARGTFRSMAHCHSRCHCHRLSKRSRSSLACAPNRCLVIIFILFVCFFCLVSLVGVCTPGCNCPDLVAECQKSGGKWQYAVPGGPAVPVSSINQSKITIVVLFAYLFRCMLATGDEAEEASGATGLLVRCPSWPMHQVHLSMEFDFVFFLKKKKINRKA